MRRLAILTGLIALLLILEVSTNVEDQAFATQKKVRVHTKQQSTNSDKRKPFLKQTEPTVPAVETASQSKNSPSTDLENTPPEKENTPSPELDKTPFEKKPLSNQYSKLKLTKEGFVNAPKPLLITTYEKSDQAVHPSVIDFKMEHNQENWRGYRYWMAMTPYPYANNRFENPSLLVSHDGVNWLVPEGLSTPIDSLPGGNHYNSDPALVYDPDEETLVLYWRETLENKYDRLWRTKILPSGKLAKKILVLEEPWGQRNNNLALSPSIWRKSKNEWYLWTISGTHSIYLYDSSDGINWINRRETQSPWVNWNGGFIPWHLEVKPNLSKGKLDMMISGWPKGQTLMDMVLVYAETPISDLTAIHFPLDQPLLTSSGSSQWDNDFIYKSSFVREDQGNQSLYHIWYSARSVGKQWRIGYTNGIIRGNVNKTIENIE